MRARESFPPPPPRAPLSASSNATAVLSLRRCPEANMDEGFMLRREQYACLFREMIASWRQAWGDAT